VISQGKSLVPEPKSKYHHEGAELHGEGIWERKAKSKSNSRIKTTEDTEENRGNKGKSKTSLAANQRK
jgi:hypothetical protein